MLFRSASVRVESEGCSTHPTVGGGAFVAPHRVLTVAHVIAGADDVDVVLDLMIHDVDILLALTGEKPADIRAAGIRILSEKVDIANVRIQFPSGCIANLTASRVSTERVRKLRLFQPHEYISLDYQRQDAVRFRVKPPMAIDFAQLPVTKDEPLRLELEGFFASIATRQPPRVTGQQGLAALEVATPPPRLRLGAAATPDWATAPLGLVCLTRKAIRSCWTWP